MKTARLTGQSALMNVMISAVEKAGRALTRDFGEVEQLQVSKKGLGDFVSTADHRSEKIIVQELTKVRPAYSFLLEESGFVEGSDVEHCWIVDPLDGTLNFLHGIPQFCISLALKRNEEILAGVIYNPILDELYVAEKGKGAFLNQRRLRVSGRRYLDEALFSLGTPNKNSVNGKNIDSSEKLFGKIAGIRHFGSAALDLAYVAAGKLDALFLTYLKPWDLAAGILLIKEAGGYVCDANKEQNILETGAVLSANDYMFESLQKILL